ncbi:MAG: VWA domain-containing protein [Chloroflexota bacterium]
MSNKSLYNRPQSQKGTNRNALMVLIVALVIIAAACCGGVALVYVLLSGDGDGAATLAPSTSSATLTVAYSPEKETLFSQLVSDFNRQGLETPDGQKMVVTTVQLDPATMIDRALTGELQAISPDSSLWLYQLDATWMEAHGTDLPVVGETVRYAVSPVVIAMWEDVARSMGYPDRPLGWEDLLNKAQSDPNFKWSHPATSSASGLLATLAEFYAGAGITRGLTLEDAQRQSTLDYVAAIEKTVRYYGEGEWAVVQRVLQEGRSYLDAWVCQEQLVVYLNQNQSDQVVAVYPQEGALWQDHPLALLETPALTTNQRLVFSRLRDFLLSETSQARVLAAGYRPGDLNLSLTDPASPLTAANGVDPAQPQTSLQLPNAAVVEVVRNVWWYTKRHTNVYLVVDVSGSMRGDKIQGAQAALRAFVELIAGDVERVGLVEFSSQVRESVPLDDLGDNRARLLATIDALEVGGDTSLLDAVALAYDNLQRAADAERINAIVVMTDGLENHSAINQRQLLHKLETQDVPVVIFCIAYGADADRATLQDIAGATGGQLREGDLETIRELYQILSTYF